MRRLGDMIGSRPWPTVETHISIVVIDSRVLHILTLFK